MSLIRVECGRVLIVVDHQDWGASSASIMLATQQQLLQQQQQQQKQQDAVAGRRFDLESFFLNSSFSSTSIATAAQAVNQSNPVLLEYKVHRTEVCVALVNFTEADDTKRGRMRMVPKAALLNLKKALEGTDLTHSRQWLGPTRNPYTTTRT